MPTRDASPALEGLSARTSGPTRSEPAALAMPRSASSKAPEMPAKAPCVGCKPPSAASPGRAEDTSSAAACGGAATAAYAPQNTRPRFRETRVGATGAAGRLVPSENRLTAGVCTIVGGAAAPSALPGDQQLSRPARRQEPEQTGLQRPSAPRQTAPAATLPLLQTLPPQLRADASPHGQRADQRTMTSGAAVGATLPPAVPRRRHLCRYCSAHGVESGCSASHRAACQYLNRCPCFKYHQLHLKNELHSERDVRRRNAAAALKAAAGQRAAGAV